MSDGRGGRGCYYWPLKFPSQCDISDYEAAYFTIKSFSGLLTERFSGQGRKEEGRWEGEGEGKGKGKGGEKEGKRRKKGKKNSNKNIN